MFDLKDEQKLKEKFCFFREVEVKQILEYFVGY